MGPRFTIVLLTILAIAAAPSGQAPEPRTAFVQSVGQFSLALAGSYGDEGPRIRTSLETMSRALAEWDDLLRRSEAAMAADVRGAERPLAVRMHLALAALYLDRTRTTDGLRELSTAQQLETTRADLPLFEALAHRQLAENHPAAIVAFRRASTLAPNDPLAAYLLARSLSRADHADEANQAYERFLANDARLASSAPKAPHAPFTDLRPFREAPGVEPFFPPAAYVDGFTALQRGEYAQAIDAFRRSALQDPLTAQNGVEAGALTRAGAALREGELDRALEHVAVAIELAPDRAEPRRVLGMIHLAGRQHAAAIDALNAALALQPRDERTRLALADAFIASDQLTAARDVLQQTVTMHPSSGHAHYMLGLVLQRQGLLAEAAGELTAAAAAKPLLGLNSIYQSLGALARAQQQYDAAIAAFSKRVDLVPNDALAHHELGEMLFRQGRDTEALAEFTAAVMLNPARTESLVSAGQVHLRAGSFAEAAAAARRATALDDSHKEAHYVLATSLVRLGLPDEARREFETYQRLQTEATAAQSRRLEIDGLRRDASVAMTNGDSATAIALLRRALESDPESAQAHLDLGIALVRSGQHAEALGHLAAAAKASDTEEAHAYLADAYAALGRRSDADREHAIVVRMRQESLRRAGAVR